ncbi:MAG: KOW domain-containing RNA-binding protein [Clostridia bacterium]|nr:KOW domain-containing RNA-binding protein [Clostridia bacterium]
MDRLSIEVGRVVQSRQGRDEGRCFVIIEVIDDQYVLMADGLTRKLDHLKKKKIKHLHPKPVLVPGIAQERSGNRLLDSDIRKSLQDAGLEIDQPLCKEG